MTTEDWQELEQRTLNRNSRITPSTDLTVIIGVKNMMYYYF